MDLTTEQKAKLLAALGRDPWSSDLVFNPDGSASVVKVETESRGAPSVFLRQLAQEGAPRAIASAVGGTAASTLAAPLIAPAATAVGAMAPAAAPVTVPATGLVLGAGAFGAGSVVGNMALDAVGAVPKLRQSITGSELQNLRDRTEHPTATKLADYVGQLAGFKFLSPRALVGGLRKVANPWRVSTGDLSLAAAEKAALKNLAGNVAMGAGVEGYRQARQGEFDPGALVESAAAGALLGDARKPWSAAGNLAGRAGLGAADIWRNFGKPRPKPEDLAPIPGGAEVPADAQALDPGVPDEPANIAEIQAQQEYKNLGILPTPPPPLQPPADFDYGIGAKPKAKRTRTVLTKIKSEPVPPPPPQPGLSADDTHLYQPAPPPGNPNRGRQLLQRRGFEFQESPDPIIMEDGRRAAGKFHTPTGQITVDPTVAGETTYAHEGMHAELQDMALSANPRVSKLAQDLMVAVAEEPLAESGAREAVGSGSRLARLLRLNWDFLRTRKWFGGGQLTPEAAARILAERFETQSPAPAPGTTGVNKYQPLDFVPHSVVGNLARQSPEAAEAVAHWHNTRDRLFGKHFNTAINDLQKFDRDLVNATLWKRLRAFQFGQQPQFTPEEAAIDARYGAAMLSSAQEATAAGYPINALPNYVPQMLNTQAARLHQSDPGWLDTQLPEFHRLNQAIYGAAYDPKEGEQYLRLYMQGAAQAPNSLGFEFPALKKFARQYFLPDDLVEPDMLRGLERYGNRFAQQVAKKLEIESNPAAMQVLGYKALPQQGALKDARSATDDARNARMAVDNVLQNEGRGSSGLSQTAKEVVTGVQQLAYSGAMQTLTALKNLITSVPMQLVHAPTAKHVTALLQGAHASLAEYQQQLDKAIKMNVVRPRRDPNAQWDEDSVASRMARNLRAVARGVRVATGADMLETYNRVRDYSIGEALAEVNLQLSAAGDPDAELFMRRFGAGVKPGMAASEAIARMARNYATAIQSSYSAEGLPAPLLKGGVVSHVGRIQRYGVENMNRMTQYVLKPAIAGDYRPLLTYLFGLTLTAPVLNELSELFSGKPSGLPTMKEVEAGGKRNPLAQLALNIMSMAQTTSAFGFAGGVAGAAAANARGNQQGVIGDPGISLVLDLGRQVAGAADAVAAGEPVVPALVMAVENALMNNVQLLRRFRYDDGEAEDVRNRRAFEYVTERRDIPFKQMGEGMLLGSVLGRTREISPTQEAARDGDAEARSKLSAADRARLNNYPGGYEDPLIEAQYRRFIKDAHGPEALAAYMQRRQRYRRPQNRD